MVSASSLTPLSLSRPHFPSLPAPFPQREGEYAQSVEQSPAASPPLILAQHIRPHLINQEPLGIRHANRLAEDFILHVASLPRTMLPHSLDTR